MRSRLPSGSLLWQVIGLAKHLIWFWGLLEPPCSLWEAEIEQKNEPQKNALHLMNPLHILDRFKNRQDVIVESIREIVEIESPSGDVERSKAVVLWVENEARK